MSKVDQFATLLSWPAHNPWVCYGYKDDYCVCHVYFQVQIISLVYSDLFWGQQSIY